MATGTAKARRFVTFDEARAAILARAAAAAASMPAESIALDDALGLTLRADLVAHEPFPRFDNSAMDGFAVRALMSPARPRPRRSRSPSPRRSPPAASPRTPSRAARRSAS